LDTGKPLVAAQRPVEKLRACADALGALEWGDGASAKIREAADAFESVMRLKGQRARENRASILKAKLAAIDAKFEAIDTTRLAVRIANWSGRRLNGAKGRPSTAALIAEVAWSHDALGASRRARTRAAGNDERQARRGHLDAVRRALTE
jgi:hypothetical protein